MSNNLTQLISQAQIMSAASGERILTHLEALTSLPPTEFTELLAKAFSYPTLNFDEMQQADPDFQRINFSDCLQKDCLLLKLEGRFLFVFADVFDNTLMAWATEKIKHSFVTYLAHRTEISAFLAKHEDETRAIHGALNHLGENIQEAHVKEELSLNVIEKDLSTVVKLVRSTLYDALKAEASDIHLETNSDGLVIKYRLDGVLSHVGAVNEVALAEQMISRIKVISELDITEQRVPQDGRFRANYRGRDVDFRVSIMPSIHGEDVVIRVLDKQTLADQAQGLRLDVLGFDPETIATMREQFSMPYGMVLVTGPTGSGKTTTLYAAVSEINQGYDKIITIEDPVEYQLPGVLQIPVNEKKGLTFARGLRSILRHDPDRIMVGEIRDTETAQIAVQSALTGHLVLTTVHANNAFDVIGRFLNMGVDPYSFVSALNIVVAQRLLRVNCPHCIEVYQPTTVLKNITIPPKVELKRSKGCGMCRGTGFKGRHAVAEVLVLDDALRELIANRGSARQIKELASKKGTRFLHDAALSMAFAGQTTLEEVQRVAPLV